MELVDAVMWLDGLDGGGGWRVDDGICGGVDGQGGAAAGAEEAHAYVGRNLVWSAILLQECTETSTRTNTSAHGMVALAPSESAAEFWVRGTVVSAQVGSRSILGS